MAILGKVSQIMKDSQSPVKPLGPPSGAPRIPVSADRSLASVPTAAEPRRRLYPGWISGDCKAAARCASTQMAVIVKAGEAVLHRIHSSATPFSRTLIPLLLLLRTHNTSYMIASRSGRRRQRGVATLELSLLMLPVLLLAELGVAGGRYAQAQAYATAAAYSAARAASLAASPQQAQSAAQSAAQASVQGAGAACGGMTASTNVSDFTPGGNVTVTVTCQVSYSNLLLLPLPGSVTVTGKAVSPVDLFRVT